MTEQENPVTGEQPETARPDAAPAAPDEAVQPEAPDRSAQPETGQPDPSEPAVTAEPAEPVVTPASVPTARPAVPSPAAVAPVVAAPAPPASAPIEPARSFGRVDEAGNVYVRTSAGERQVGQWQAGSPEEALAFFERRFENLKVEVDLLTRRIRGEGGAQIDAEEATSTIARLRESLVDAAAVGDLDGLAARLEALVGLVEAKRGEAAERKAQAKAEAKVKREAVVAEAESLAESTSWKATGERFRTLLDEWKAAPRIDRPTEQALWKRFSSARTTFDRRRRAHFAELGNQRDEAKARKIRLAAEAESLADSTDWGPTARRFRDLMREWKDAGRASRAEDDALWERFRTAQDSFFAARNAVQAERDVELQANLEVKEALLVEAEALLPITDHRKAREAMRRVHEKWEAAGHVPRADRDRVEGRLRKVDDAIREAEQSEWQRTNPEARARAADTSNALRESIQKLEKQLATAEANGDTRKADEARAGIAARREWLAEAEKALADFSS